MPTTNKIVGNNMVIKSSFLPNKNMSAKVQIIAIKTVTIGMTVPKNERKLIIRKIITSNTEANKKASLLYP